MNINSKLIFVSKEKNTSGANKKRKKKGRSSDESDDDDYQPSFSFLKEQQAFGNFTFFALQIYLNI